MRIATVGKYKMRKSKENIQYLSECIKWTKKNANNAKERHKEYNDKVISMHTHIHKYESIDSYECLEQAGSQVIIIFLQFNTNDTYLFRMYVVAIIWFCCCFGLKSEFGMNRITNTYSVFVKVHVVRHVRPNRRTKRLSQHDTILWEMFIPLIGFS